MIPKQMQSLSNPYLIDNVCTMRNQEMTAYKLTRDYLHRDFNVSTPSSMIVVTPSDRKKMLSWAYDIMDICKIDRCVAITAMTYLDRFLSNSICRRAKVALSSRQEFQLCFITCLIIAIKNRGGMSVSSHFISKLLCHGLYSANEILQIELEILSGLTWKLNGPTATDFVHAFLQLMPHQKEAEVMESLIELAEAQVEIAMMDYALAFQEPSSIAYSSVLVAMDSMGCSDVDMSVWMQSISMITGHDAADSRNELIRRRLIEITPLAQACFCYSPDILKQCRHS